ncbi:collagen-like protein [Streptomyces sp. NPDC058067]|uniref:collagen-like protein n=1 Tax=Streptomyces sp. NPDC058067 TaxID=3346324 RepID=UPI0036E5B374
MRSRHTNSQIQHRRDIIYGVLVLAGVLLFTALVLWLQELNHDLRTANDARDALARQVQQLGHKPVAGPPGSRGEPGKSVVGPRGAQGQQGEPGPIGPTGPIGPSGKPGRDGAHGSNGADGVGQTGAAGADGVPGPSGPPGAKGETGPQGPPGVDGKDGKDGADGRDGQTCPEGYSLQAPAYDPDALVCRRDSAPQPQKKNSGGLLSMGLDPQRRQYE